MSRTRWLGYLEAWCKKRHGFDRAQVQQHIANLEANLRLLTADRDSALSQMAAMTGELDSARAEAAELRARTGDLSQSADNADEVHDRLRVMVDVTRAEAAEITARAQAAAELTWADAQRSADALRQRYEAVIADLEAAQAEMRAEHAASLARTRTETERMAAEAEQRRAQLGERAEQEYRRVEQEFQESMRLRRAELDREIADRHAASVAEAERIVRAATEEANRRTEWANHKLRELADLRLQVAQRLRETSTLLAKSNSLLEPHESEAELMGADPRYDGDSRYGADPRYDGAGDPNASTRHGHGPVQR